MAGKAVQPETERNSENFSLALGQGGLELRRAGEREICWAHSRADGIRGMEGREQDQGEVGAVIVARAAHPGLVSGTPGSWPN